MAIIYDPSSLLEINTPKYGLLVPNRLFVGGLSPDVKEADLKNFFSTFGPIKHCKILFDSNGMSKGYGFITFVYPEDVDKLLKKEGETILLKDKKINIGPAVRKQPQAPFLNAASQTSQMMPQSNLLLTNNLSCVVQQQQPQQNAQHQLHSSSSTTLVPSLSATPTLTGNSMSSVSNNCNNGLVVGGSNFIEFNPNAYYSPHQLHYQQISNLISPSFSSQQPIQLMVLPNQQQQQLQQQTQQLIQSNISTPGSSSSSSSSSSINQNFYLEQSQHQQLMQIKQDQSPQHQQLQADQSLHYYIPTSSLLTSNFPIEQSLYQFPCVVQSIQQQQQQQQSQQYILQQQQFQSQNVLKEIDLRKQQQLLQQKLFKQQIIFPQNNSLLDMSQLTNLSEVKPSVLQLKQTSSSSSSSSLSMGSIENKESKPRLGVKRNLSETSSIIMNSSINNSNNNNKYKNDTYNKEAENNDDNNNNNDIKIALNSSKHRKLN